MTIQRYGGQAPWESQYGYCRVVLAGGWAITAGTTATAPDGRALHPGDPYRQTATAFGIALQSLALAGARVDQVVRTRMYVADIAQKGEIGRAHRDTFGDVQPVATMVEVVGLADPQHLVEVEVEAFLGG